MNRYIAVLIAVIALAVLFSTATSQQPPVARRSVFSTMKVVQTVSLKERAGCTRSARRTRSGRLPTKLWRLVTTTSCYETRPERSRAAFQ